MAIFSLINLAESGVFEFQFFPAKISFSDRNNWEAQNTTIGVKPLFYANREPRRITVDDVWFDNTDIGEPILLDDLFKLMQENPERGTPPPLLAVWGEHQERVVLEEIEVSEEFFNEDGGTLRARLRLTLMQIQPDNAEESNVIINE